MLINYKLRNVELTEAIQEYAQKRLSKFDKLIGVKEATVTVRSIKDRYRLEVAIPFHGMLIRGEDEGYDIYACVDIVTDKLESQIHKYRSRLIQRGRRDKAVIQPVPPVVEEHWVEDDEPVKVKSFTTKPMSVEEAIMQMNLLGHSFFVFVNIDTGATNVLYRRYDGEYGLLVPEE